MSTDDSFTEDVLKCAVCYDLLDDPRTLVCGHTFCLGCLQNYASIHDEAIRARAIPCPLCRQLTEVPDPHAPLGEWAGQMRSTTVVQEFVEMLEICKQSTERGDDTNNEKLTHMMCGEHDQNVVLFCKDCQAPLCPACCEAEHKPCQSLVPIQSILPDITAQLSETKEKLTLLSQLTIGRCQRRRRNREDLMIQKKITQQKIRDMCQKVIRAVRKREKLLLEDLELEANEQASGIQLGVRLSERTATVQKRQSDLIEKVLQSGTDIDKYNMFKVSEKLYFEDEGSEQKGHTARFALHNEIETVDAALDRVLGSIEVVYDTQTPAGPELDVDGVVVIRTDDDEEDPFPVDIAMVSYSGVQSLVVTDNSNCCVKSFFIESVVSHSRLSFCSPPWGLARLMTNQVLVALPESKQIARVKVTPDLHLISKIATTKEYRSITALGPSAMAAGSSNSEEPCVDILDFKGRVLKSFTSQFPLQNPSYLSVLNNGKIVISDHGLGAITCVSTESLMDFTYRRGLKGPSGVAVTHSGGIVVVDREQGALVQYDAYDKYALQRPKLTPLANTYEKPLWGVCIDTDGRIFITQGEVVRVVSDLDGMIGQSNTIASVFGN